MRHAFHDRQTAEEVNQLTKDQVADLLLIEFGVLEVSANRFERGEVLIDSRGQGSLQQVNGEKSE